MKPKYKIIWRPANIFGGPRAVFFKLIDRDYLYAGYSCLRPEGGTVRVTSIELIPFNPPIFNN